MFLCICNTKFWALFYCECGTLQILTKVKTENIVDGE